MMDSKSKMKQMMQQMEALGGEDGGMGRLGGMLGDGSKGGPRMPF